VSRVLESTTFLVSAKDMGCCDDGATPTPVLSRLAEEGVEVKGDRLAPQAIRSVTGHGAEVGQTCAPNETGKLHSVFATDARSSFRAEVKMTDASSCFSKLSSDDATDAS
jgi:hypothetical protein